MICVFDIGNTTYTGNGDAVLLPTECKVKQVAGGEYSLSMTHPIDDMGKWMHLIPEAVIRAPIPEETIESAISGMEADVYVTNTEATMRSGTSEPTNITYSEWVYGQGYAVGDRVTCSGQTHRNYRCTYWDADSSQVLVPPYASSWWAQIADKTSGSPVITTLRTGTEVYLIQDMGNGWYQVTTAYGLIGYVKASQLTYSRHLTPEETEPVTINEQLFRIRSVSVDTKNNQISVTAEHVSYDLRGIMIQDVTVTRQTPAMALAWIQEGFMTAYDGTIATNLTESTDGTITEKINGKNAVYALLDPDQGIVSYFNAACRRNNWDFYVMRKASTDRGFRLRYQKNILGVNWNIKSDNLITRVIPVAKAEDGSDFFLTNKWVDSSRISNYPVIRTEWLKVAGQVGRDDGSETDTVWTEAALRTEMQSKAQARFDKDKVDQLEHEITVDFVTLGDTAEHAELKELEEVVLYDTVTVIDERIQLAVTVEVIELEWDAIRQKITALKLSNVAAYAGKNVSGFNVLNNSVTGVKLTDDAIDTIAERSTDVMTPIMEQAIGSAASALRTWANGRFVIAESE